MSGTKRANAKQFGVRVVCITLAGLMLMSVILSVVWRW